MAVLCARRAAKDRHIRTARRSTRVRAPIFDSKSPCARIGHNPAYVGRRRQSSIIPASFHGRRRAWSTIAATEQPAFVDRSARGTARLIDRSWLAVPSLGAERFRGRSPGVHSSLLISGGALARPPVIDPLISYISPVEGTYPLLSSDASWPQTATLVRLRDATTSSRTLFRLFRFSERSGRPARARVSSFTSTPTTRACVFLRNRRSRRRAGCGYDIELKCEPASLYVYFAERDNGIRYAGEMQPCGSIICIRLF